MNAMEERYEGHFLEAIDLPEGASCPVTIEAVADPDTETDASGKLIHKALVRFKDKAKRLVLNRTNYRMLKVLLGKNPADWLGKTVHLQRRYLDAAHAFGQKNELCIRVIPPAGTPIPKSVRDFMGSASPQGEK